MLKIEERKDEMPNDSDFKWLLASCHGNLQID